MGRVRHINRGDKPVYCKKEDKPCYDKRTAITAANKRYKEDRIRLRIYPCGDHWHLTKQVGEDGERWKQYR